MFVVENFFKALASIVYYLLELYMYVFIARAVISWVNPDPWNPIVQFLEKVTEPALAPITVKDGDFIGFCRSASHG